MAEIIHAPLLRLPDTYYPPIGAILHGWATLEYLLKSIIWDALGLDDPTGRVLTVGMNIQPLVGILRNLPRRWVTDPSMTDDIRSLCNDTEEAAKFRNAIVHGVWTADPNDPELIPWLSFMKEGAERILPTTQQIGPDYLCQFAQTVHQLNQRADTLVERIRNAPAPLLDTPDERIP